MEIHHTVGRSPFMHQKSKIRPIELTFEGNSMIYYYLQGRIYFEFLTVIELIMAVIIYNTKILYDLIWLCSVTLDMK